jgi:hypothetical protein
MHKLVQLRTALRRSRRRAVRRLVRAPWVGALVMIAGGARAQTGAGATVHGAAAPPGRQAPMSGPMFVRSTEAVDAAARGRALMAKGDCDKAVESFDVALRTMVDPTVQRDRGICHEKLGQPFPAIEDYRAYLFKMPESPDSDAIRERLTALEQASSGSDSKTEGLLAPDWQNQAGIMDSPGLRGGATSSVKVSAPTKGARPKDQVDQLEEQERLDNDAAQSPLRRGSGFIIGPYFQYRSWGLSSLNLGTGYGVGASVRQAFGSISTLMLDLGFASYASNQSENSASFLGTLALGEQRSGFDMTLAYEARIRFDSRCSNALTLSVGGELTDLVYSTTKYTFFSLLARGRVGYRHVFGPSLGVEVAFDVAQPFLGTGSAVTNAVGTSTLWQTTVIGGYGGLMLGF